MATQSMNFDSIADSCRNISSLSGSFETTISTAGSAVGKIKGNAWEGEAAENFSSEMKNLVDKLPAANQQLAYSVLYLTSVSDGYEALGESTVNKLINMVGGQAYIDSLDVSGLPDPNLTVNTDNSNKSIDPKNDTNQTYNNDQSNGNNSNNNNNNGNSNGNSSGGGNWSDGGGNWSSGGDTSGGGTSEIPSQSSKVGQTIEIPANIKQSGYTVTGYDYWIKTGEKMVWASGTNQEKVSEIWAKQGSRFKHGMAVINVNGKDRYLIAVTPTFGEPGECLDVQLEDGTIIPCIIGDSKGSDAGSEWGHSRTDGSVNVLEFEVERAKFLQSGNPTTETWGLEWDSNKAVKSMKNLGTIIGAPQTDKTVTLNTVINTPVAA